MGTKKLQGADGMNFQLQLTIKGLESINLPEENLANESGNDIMKISCWGGKLSAYVNLPKSGNKFLVNVDKFIEFLNTGETEVEGNDGDNTA